MKACVLGGAGFLGRRIVRVLAARGYGVVCVDVAAADFCDLGKQVKAVRTVRCVVQPALGHGVRFAYRDRMRCASMSMTRPKPSCASG